MSRAKAQKKLHKYLQQPRGKKISSALQKVRKKERFEACKIYNIGRKLVKDDDMIRKSTEEELLRTADK